MIVTDAANQNVTQLHLALSHSVVESELNGRELQIYDNFCPQGRRGKIKYLFESYAFLHSNRYPNGGYFVCQTRDLRLARETADTGNVSDHLYSLRVPSMKY